MTTELIHVLNGNVLRYTGTLTPSGLYRIRLPEGTRLWRMGIRTYQYEEAATAVLRLDEPPTDLGTLNGPDISKTLQRLWDGETLGFYSPPNSGTLTISSPDSTTQFRTDRERWLYLKMQFPSGRVYSWDSHIELHADAKVDDEGLGMELAMRALDYANRSGLTAALMRTAKASTEAELISWVQKQDDLWPSLCRMVSLAETANR